MAGEEILGHGKIIVEVEQNVRRELAEAEAQFDRTMEKLDRKEAELKLAIDAKQFEAEYKKINEQLDRWDKKRSSATAEIDVKKAEDNIARLEKKQKNLQLAEERFNNRAKQLATDRAAAEEKKNKAIARSDQKLSAARAAAEKAVTNAARKEFQERAKFAEKQMRDSMRNEKRRLDALVKSREAATREAEKEFQETARIAEKQMRADIASENKRVDAISKAREAAERKSVALAEAEFKARARSAEKTMRDEIRSEERRVQSATKARNDEERLREVELNQVKRLTKQYLELSRRKASSEDKKQRVFLSREERVKIDVDIDAFDEQLRIIKERLDRVGHPPPTIEFDVDERGTQTLARWSKALSDTTVRLGPFTTTIGGAIRALTLLGPVIAGVVGATGALAGAIGAGVAGAVGLSVSALTGFIPLLVGTVTAVKPIIQGFSDATKAQKKYDDAVAKYGAKSKQAKEANKQLASVLAHMPESTQKAIKGVNDLRDSWTKATQGAARQNFAKVLNAGLENANKLMPMFAARTRGFMNRVGDGLKGFLNNLGSGGNKFQLDRIFNNTNKAVTPLISGLSHLTTAFLRITGQFSDYLPDLAKGFNDWALGIAKVSGNTQKTGPVIKGMVDGFKALVHIVGSATKLVATFFGVAAGPGGGINFLNDIADGMDRITANISDSPGGLTNYFKDSISTAKDLYSVIQPLASLFVEWATIMRPFSNVILNVGAALGKVVSAMAGFGPTKALLIGAFSVFLAGTLASKVLSVAGAIREVVVAIQTLGKAKVAASVLDFLTGGFSGNVGGAIARRRAAKAGASGAAGQIIDFAAVGGGAKAAEKAAVSASAKMGALEVAAGGAGAALGGLGTAGTIAATGGLALVAAGAVYGGYKLITMKSSADKLRDSLHEISNATKAYNDTTSSLAQATNAAGESQRNYQQSVGRVAAIKERLNKLEADGKKNTSAYRDTLAQLNTELHNREKNEGDVQRYMGLASKEHQKAAQLTQVLTGAKAKYNDTLKKQAEAQKYADATAGNPNLRVAGQKKLADATKEVSDAQKVYNSALAAQQHAARQAAANALNYQRTLAGMVPVAGKAASALAKLYTKAPKTAQTIALKYADPKDAGAVAARASATLQKGVKSSIVTKVVVDSRNAEQALRRLATLGNIKTNMSVVTKGGSEAVALLTKLKGTKLTPKQQKVAVNGGGEALALMAKLLGIKLKPKVQKTLESGGQNAIAVLSKILGIKIPAKVVKTVVQDSATAALNALRAKAGQPIVQVVNFRTGSGYGGAARRAKGRGPIGRETALVGEGGGPELVADHATGSVMKVSSPTVLSLRPTESVIPTEPKYRGRGRNLLAQFARDVGIPMFAAGRAAAPRNRDGYHGNAGYYPTKFTPRTPGAYTEGRRKHNIAGAGFGKGLKLLSNSPSASYVKQLQIKQSDLANEISIKERQIKEPDTFLRPTGAKDANGDPVLEVDTNLVSSYKSKLADLKTWQDNLAAAIAEEVKYLPKALDELASIRRDSSSNIKKLNAEKNRVQKAITAEQRKKNPNKEKVTNLKNRLTSLTRESTRESKIHDDAVTDSTTFKGRQRDAGFDYRNAQLDASDTQSDLDAVDGTVSSQSGSAGVGGAGGGAGGGSGGGGTGGAGGGSDDPGATSIAKGNYEVTAGQASGNSDLVAQGYRDQITGYQDQINAANAMLNDGNPANDADAYNLLNSATQGFNDASSALKDLTDPLGGLTAGQAAINRTDALVAEAKAGIVDPLTGTVPNLTDALNASLEAHKTRLGEYQAMLKDSDPTNDAEAWQGISTEAGIIQGIQDDLGTSAQAQYNNAMSLSGARQNLFTSFASNYQLSGTMNGPSSPLIGRGSLGYNSGVSEAQTAHIVVNNTFPTPPPDPHTFSQGLRFELGASL